MISCKVPRGSVTCSRQNRVDTGSHCRLSTGHFPGPRPAPEATALREAQGSTRPPGALSAQRQAQPQWVPEPVVVDQIIAILAKLAFPREVCDWAIAYLRHILAKDVTDAETELRRLTKKAGDMQAGLDVLLAKAAQTDEALADEFLRLARQKQSELAMVRHRMDTIRTGKQTQSVDLGLGPSGALSPHQDADSPSSFLDDNEGFVRATGASDCDPKVDGSSPFGN